MSDSRQKLLPELTMGLWNYITWFSSTNASSVLDKTLHKGLYRVALRQAMLGSMIAKIDLIGRDPYIEEYYQYNSGDVLMHYYHVTLGVNYHPLNCRRDMLKEDERPPESSRYDSLKEALMFTNNHIINLDEKKIINIYSKSNSRFYFTKTKLFANGRNIHGELAQGHNKICPFVVQIHLPTGKQVKKVVSGANLTYFMSEDDEWFACGRNDFGQLGQYHRIGKHKPVSVSINIKNAIKDVVIDEGSVFLLTVNGEVLSCGQNNNYQLGSSNNGNLYFNELQQVYIPNDRKVKEIIAKNGTTLFLTEDGNVYSCGKNDKGQLGQGHHHQCVALKPVVLPKGTKITNVCIGHDSIYLLTENGIGLSCGLNSHGQLGQGHNEDCNEPKPIKIPDGKKIKNIRVGMDCVYIITEDGVVFTCGSNNAGQLGHGNTSDSNTPIQIKIEKKIIDVFTEQEKYSPVYFLAEDGIVYRCGIQVESTNILMQPEEMKHLSDHSARIRINVLKQYQLSLDEIIREATEFSCASHHQFNQLLVQVMESSALSSMVLAWNASSEAQEFVKRVKVCEGSYYSVSEKFKLCFFGPAKYDAEKVGRYMQVYINAIKKYGSVSESVLEKLHNEIEKLQKESQALLASTPSGHGIKI